MRLWVIVTDPGSHNYSNWLFSGGLVCRGILEQFSEAKVNTFISLSSPQAGQFGGKIRACLRAGGKAARYHVDCSSIVMVIY